MPLSLLVTLLAAGAFVIGGVPFGLLLARLKGLDIRTVGSGNMGAANVGRALGFRWGVAVFMLDMLKGLVPTLVAGRLLLNSVGTNGVLATTPLLGWMSIGIAAVLGHNYSVFLGFRGGKGVSTSLGITLGFFPDLTYAALLALAAWAVGLAVTRMTSVGALAGALLLPLFYWMLTPAEGSVAAHRWPFFALTSLIALLVVVRHRSNIQRILAGTENRVGRSTYRL
jgi:glycerol-3-phosphate acyltransferase PlsY